MKTEAPNYLISLIPKREQTFNTRSKHLPTYNCRTDSFKYLFFPCTLNDWSNLQKQPPRGVPRKRCSENMQQTYRRTPMPKCDLNKVTLQLH